MIATWFAANGLRVGFYAALVLGLMGFGAYKMHQHDARAYDKLETTYLTFKSGVEAEGKRAQKEADQQKAADLAAKEKADENHKNAVAGLTAQLERLRRQHPPGGTVPAAPADSAKPQLACFDRTLLGGAVDGLLADLQRQAGSGAAATVDLDNAKGWTQRKGVMQ